MIKIKMITLYLEQKLISFKWIRDLQDLFCALWISIFAYSTDIEGMKTSLGNVSTNVV